jgi:small subunit ribosomal protein S1
MENHSEELPEVTSVSDLKKGMEVQGTVKRVTDVGVFIDAGLDGEGFLHVSEYRPLGKDKGIEYHEGDPITVWVKQVDANVKSFRATLKAPPKYRMSDLKVGMIVTGKVTRIATFGAFVDIGARSEGLVHVSELADGFVRNPSEVVSVGDEIQVKILKLEGNRISLSIKAVKAEEEKAPQEVEEAEEEEELPTVMEVALQQARERSGSHEKRRSKGQSNRRSDEMDDIIARTLQYHREQSKKQ